MATEPPEPGDAPPVQFKKVAFKKKANVKRQIVVRVVLSMAMAVSAAA